MKPNLSQEGILKKKKHNFFTRCRKTLAKSLLRVKKLCSTFDLILFSHTKLLFARKVGQNETMGIGQKEHWR